MKHFLVTRFNLRRDNWKTSRDGQEVLTEEWLSHRFSLFERYCLPSVKNQSNQNFIWCVLFDTETPRRYRAKIESISSSYPNFKPLFIHGIDEYRASVKNFIALNLGEEDRYVITTRLDNDDLIHKDFIHRIQRLSLANLLEQGKIVVDLRKGYQVGIEGDKIVEIRKARMELNPFLSLVEDTTDVSSIASRKHAAWKDSVPMVVFDKKELWIQLIHEKNMLNAVNRYAFMVWKLKAGDFGLAAEIKAERKLLAIFWINIRFLIGEYMELGKEFLKRLTQKKARQFPR